MQKAYDYFISYASENANWARTLRSMLPRTASVFFAEEVPKGQDWETTIRRAITGTRNFVVLVSSASSSATYQRAEVDFALRAAEVDPGMRITPVCVGIGDDALPLGLNLKQAIVITTADEMPQAVAHLVRKPVESGVEENVGALVMELERLLVEKHSSPRTVAWGQDIGSANSGTNRNTRISDLSDKITSGFQPRAGSIVAGATLIKVIGQGAFADVWEAKRRDGSSVAVKVLRAGLLQRDLTLWRFRRGAEALQRLGERKRQKQAGVQPGCVMDLLEIDDSGLAYAMPLMGHGTLESMATFRWSLEQKLVAFDRICSAVQYAHEQTIIHRDIKPGNVMVNDQFQLVLSDFDIADNGLATQFSTTVGGLGTPVFAAPEQLQSATDSTERSDIFSLGRLLHFMLIERSPGPYVGESDLDNLATFDPALVEVVRRCCQRLPVERFANVEEVRQALHSRQRPLVRLRAGSLRVARTLRKFTYMFVVLLALAATAVAVGVVGLVAYRKSSEQQKQLEALFDSYTALDERNAAATARQNRSILATQGLKEQIDAKEKEIRTITASLALAQTAGDKAFKQRSIATAESELASLKIALATKDAEIAATMREGEAFREEQKKERMRINGLRKEVAAPTLYDSWLRGYSANRNAEAARDK